MQGGWGQEVLAAFFNNRREVLSKVIVEVRIKKRITNLVL